MGGWSQTWEVREEVCKQGRGRNKKAKKETMKGGKKKVEGRQGRGQEMSSIFHYLIYFPLINESKEGEKEGQLRVTPPPTNVPGLRSLLSELWRSVSGPAASGTRG